MSEATELNPNDIQHDGGIAVGGNQPQAQREDSGQAEPMPAEEQAAVAKLAELRKEASDPTLDHAQRDAIMQKMSDLSKHAFLGEKSPAWYNAQPDPKATDNRAYDGLDEISAQVNEPMTDAQHEQLVTHGKIIGLHPSVADAAVRLTHAMGMSETVSKIMINRVAKHVGMTSEHPAESGFTQLTPAEQQEYSDAFAKAVGGYEKAEALANEARALMIAAGHEDVLKHLENTSLAFDPWLLQTLILHCKTARKVK